MFIKTKDNLSLYVNKVGTGANCIYIHGGPGAWSKDFEVFCKDYLSKDLTMYYMDQRGCGRSEGDEYSDYSVDAIIDDIEFIRKQFNIDKVILLAHSFGGILATAYAHKYPENIKGLILMNCTLDMKESLKSQVLEGCKILGIDNINNNKDLKISWQNIIQKLLECNLYYKLQYSNFDNYLKVSEIDKGILNTSMAEQAFSNYSYFYDYRDISKEIKTATLIISGEEDLAIGSKHYMTFNFQNYDLKIIKGRHAPYIENTTELINSIKKFISNLVE